MRCQVALLIVAAALLVLTATPAVCSDAAYPVPAEQDNAAVLERSTEAATSKDHSSAFDEEDFDDDETDDDDDDEELVGRDVVTQRRRSKWDGIKAHVLLIRHGEKVDDDSVGLSHRGKERAQCIKNYFSEGDEKVDYILAQNFFPSGRRIRPYDTVKPLANDLGIKVDHHCERDDARCVRRAIRKASKKGARRILVCWEHKELSRIAKKLGVHGLDYPDDRYDVIFDLYRGKVADVSSEHCPGLDQKWAR